MTGSAAFAPTRFDLTRRSQAWWRVRFDDEPLNLISLVRLTASPAMTITALRRRARGPGSEFSLPTDTRFTSRERGVLGQFEVDDLDLDARIADFTDDR